MKSTDRERFTKLMVGLGEYYGKQVTPMLADIYWNGLQAYDFEAVNAAVNLHVKNTDNGQFMPKIADIERSLHGNTSTRAMQAWVKVSKAIQEVGSYQSVKFDDSLIHSVIDDMGGWPQLGQTNIDELPFKIKEFERRYMAYLQVPPMREAPPMLPGIYERTNATLGYHGSTDVKLIGNQTLESQRKALIRDFATDEGLQP